MEILHALGVDWTLFVHLALFGISYLFFTNLVLKPYMSAMHEREKRTLGSEEMAIRLIEEANQLQSKYESKAKALNTEVKGFYDRSRNEAMAEYDAFVGKARAEAAVHIRNIQTEMEKQVQAARQALSVEIPAVGATIASKLAGKEIAL